MRRQHRYKFLYIIPLILVSLACGVSSQLPPKVVTSDALINTEASTAVKMTVTGSLNIRADHTEESADIGDLFTGQTVTCEEFVAVGDSVWCRHERGWSNARWLRVVEEKEKE